MAYRILVVDDDKNLVRSVRLYLEQADFNDGVTLATLLTHLSAL